MIDGNYHSQPTSDRDVTHFVAQSAEHRLRTVRERIRQAEEEYGREPGSVRLLAVSKTHPLDALLELRAAGQVAFGESYVQEAVEKIQAADDPQIEWHFIGRVQSNKTREIAEHFAWVHSVCDGRHARRLNDQRPEELPPLNICIQVNVSGEASKGGSEPEAVGEILEYCRTLPRLRVRGLMAIPAQATQAEEKRAPFRLLRRLRDDLRESGMALDTLSMGMSADLEEAIAEGATLVRVGTALFGPRHYAQH